MRFKKLLAAFTSAAMAVTWCVPSAFAADETQSGNEKTVPDQSIQFFSDIEYSFYVFNRSENNEEIKYAESEYFWNINDQLIKGLTYGETEFADIKNTTFTFSGVGFDELTEYGLSESDIYLEPYIVTSANGDEKCYYANDVKSTDKEKIEFKASDAVNNSGVPNDSDKVTEIGYLLLIPDIAEFNELKDMEPTVTDDEGIYISGGRFSINTACDSLVVDQHLEFFSDARYNFEVQEREGYKYAETIAATLYNDTDETQELTYGKTKFKELRYSTINFENIKFDNMENDTFKPDISDIMVEPVIIIEDPNAEGNYVGVFYEWYSAANDSFDFYVGKYYDEEYGDWTVNGIGYFLVIENDAVKNMNVGDKFTINSDGRLICVDKTIEFFDDSPYMFFVIDGENGGKAARSLVAGETEEQLEDITYGETKFESVKEMGITIDNIGFTDLDQMGLKPSDIYVVPCVRIAYTENGVTKNATIRAKNEDLKTADNKIVKFRVDDGAFFDIENDKEIELSEEAKENAVVTMVGYYLRINGNAGDGSINSMEKTSLNYETGERLGGDTFTINYASAPAQELDFGADQPFELDIYPAEGTIFEDSKNIAQGAYYYYDSADEEDPELKDIVYYETPYAAVKDGTITFKNVGFQYLAGNKYGLEPSDIIITPYIELNAWNNGYAESDIKLYVGEAMPCPDEIKDITVKISDFISNENGEVIDDDAYGIDLVAEVGYILSIKGAAGNGTIDELKPYVFDDDGNIAEQGDTITINDGVQAGIPDQTFEFDRSREYEFVIYDDDTAENYTNYADMIGEVVFDEAHGLKDITYGETTFGQIKDMNITFNNVGFDKLTEMGLTPSDIYVIPYIKMPYSHNGEEKEKGWYYFKDDFMADQSSFTVKVSDAFYDENTPIGECVSDDDTLIEIGYFLQIDGNAGDGSIDKMKPATLKEDGSLEAYGDILKINTGKAETTVEVPAYVKVFAQSGDPDYTWSDNGGASVTIKEAGDTVQLSWDSIGNGAVEAVNAEGLQITLSTDDWQEFVGQSINVEITGITVDGEARPDIKGTYTITANWNNTGAEVNVPLGLTSEDLGKPLSLTVKVDGKLVKNTTPPDPTPTPEPEPEPEEKEEPAAEEWTWTPPVMDPAVQMASYTDSFRVKVTYAETGKSERVRAVKVNDITTVYFERDQDGKYANVYDGDELICSVQIKYGRAKIKGLETNKFTVIADDKAYDAEDTEE